MAERMREIYCIDCIHLQRDDPYISGQMALYRCSCQGRDGKVAGWVQKDKPKNGLKKMGCSGCNKLYPGDVILCHARFKEVTAKWLYCGSVQNGKLMYNKNKMEYKVVPKDWFRGQTGRLRTGISVLKQNKAQLEASKRMAKKRKARWLEKNEST